MLSPILPLSLLFSALSAGIPSDLTLGTFPIHAHHAPCTRPEPLVQAVTTLSYREANDLPSPLLKRTVYKNSVYVLYTAVH